MEQKPLLMMQLFQNMKNIEPSRPLQNAPIARPEERGRRERTLVRDLARTTRTPLEAILERS
ncbi:MAG: hypothetical protein A2Y14_00230 [Verrucomicrobia bacterium GWF2_51_19]|nr:MAG: hypothetical protein A2Y14_00230 [Verrucomicrobia bacterium GWF2_51_19]